MILPTKPAASPSKVAHLKELISSMSLSVAVQREIAEILESYESLIYCLSEDNKRLTATIRKHDEQLRSLETRYSELLYKYSVR